jgi:hypothetical protein
MQKNTRKPSGGHQGNDKAVRRIFGSVEWQKRGVPHCHLLLFSNLENEGAQDNGTQDEGTEDTQ